MATRYGPNGPGIESRCGRDFPHPSRPAPGPVQPPAQKFAGVKRPRRGADHPPPSRAEVKEIVELYLCLPSGPAWPLTGQPLPLPNGVLSRVPATAKAAITGRGRRQMHEFTMNDVLVGFFIRRVCIIAKTDY